MRLLRKNVLIEPLPTQERSSGGIVLPADQVGDLKMFWRVLGIGPLVQDIAVGETAITPLHFSHTTLEDGTDRKIVESDQIIGKLEEDVPVI